MMVPLALAALVGCTDNTPTEPMPRTPSLRPLLGAFPGNNGRIAFAGHADGGIHTMNSDGTDVQPLTPDGAGPAWNATGTILAFYSPLTEGGPTEIFVVNADGSARTQLTFSSLGRGLAFPTWSPDGSKIAFQNDFDSKLYVMDSDGTDVTPLTAGPDFSPAWSPDGARIAFTSTRDNGVTEIYVMNADGSNQTRLTDNLVPDFDPSWSPDGSKIAFSHEGGNPGDNSEIYVMNANGTGVANLTNSALRADVLASWSPDGTKIAFVSSDDTNAEVYVMNADGTDQTNISNSAAREFHLDWQPQPAAPVCVFGPTVYTRTQGPPGRIVENFSATPGSYSVDLDDLATAGSDAVVTLNGVVILEGRATSGEVGPRHHTIAVTLLANNVLEVNVRGKKGSKLQVTICPS